MRSFLALACRVHVSIGESVVVHACSSAASRFALLVSAAAGALDLHSKPYTLTIHRKPHTQTCTSYVLPAQTVDMATRLAERSSDIRLESTN